MNERNFMNIQLFAEGDNGGQIDPNINGGDGNHAAEPTAEEIKALYEAEKAEKARLKSALDKTNSENAAYKKAERERLTQAEQDEIARKERDEEFAKLKLEINRAKAEKEFTASGVSETDYKAVLDTISPLCGDDLQAVSKSIVALLNKVKVATTNEVKNSLLKNNVVFPTGKEGGKTENSVLKKVQEMHSGDRKRIELN